MSELPKGWSETTLGALSEYITSGSRDWSKYYSETGALFVRTQDINTNKINHSKSIAKVSLPEKIEGKRTLIQKGDILITITGANVGKCAHIAEELPEAYVSQSVALVRLIDRNLSKFIQLQLITPTESDFKTALEASAYGMGRPVLNLDNVRDVAVKLAPINEQTRIVQKLDELLAQVDTLKARIDAIPSMLKRYRQSVLAAAVTGSLTEKWREVNSVSETGLDVIKRDQLAKQALLEKQPDLKKKKSSIQSEIDENYLFAIPESWAFTTWGKISEWITYGFTRPMPKSVSGKKLLTAKDVQRFALELVECGLTTTDAFESLSDKDRPQNGDLLITKDGSIGRAALVRTEEEFCINQSVAVCWLRSTAMNKSYLELLSNSDFTQRFVLNKAQGMAIQHLSIIDFAKCPLPVPPDSEQNEIVRLVEQLFAFADQLEAKVQNAKERIDKLTQSILAKAFRGELAPQDPNDEQASVLLERIKAQRAAEPKTKRGRKRAESA